MRTDDGDVMLPTLDCTVPASLGVFTVDRRKKTPPRVGDLSDWGDIGGEMMPLFIFMIKLMARSMRDFAVQSFSDGGFREKRRDGEREGDCEGCWLDGRLTPRC
mmetsp:Transcript_40917/g.102226  ORF Transcript_40917/g.102226 Transcript_40917/m.102226 type:complete len:104 (+) Transcript_40917:196-507(+)